MKFDVIIGNPPYQLDDGGSKASAKPIYQHFVEQAKILLPRYLTMIVPARWYSGGKGLNSFRKSMLNDRRLTRLVDYFDSTEVFPGVDISGGVCYFLWDRDNPSDATITTVRDGVESSMVRPLLEQSMNAFIRFNEGVNIFRKVQSLKEGSFSELISSRKPFGLDTNVSLNSKKKSDDDVFVYAYPENGFISKDKISKGTSMINEEKVFISYAYGERGSFPYLVLGKPFVGEIGTACSETYLLISANNNPLHVQNILNYIKTKFFRFLVLLRKNTQHATKGVYSLVPTQDFSEEWTDNKLYAKYNLSEDEIEFIESMIRPMDLEE